MRGHGKGWLFYVDDLPGIDTWVNASPRGIYHIIDAEHVKEMNRNPKFQCCNCGNVVCGYDKTEEECQKCHNN